MRILNLKATRIVLSVAVLASVSTGLAAETSSVPAAVWKWVRQADSVALMSGDQTVWRFNYGTNESKPCFHPVALPGGPEMTCYRPADHKWHCGFWFSWKYINGINYWEEDPQSLAAAGRTEWRNVVIETRPDNSARIQMEVIYHPATSLDPALSERRIVEVSAPAKNGQYYFDWDATFTAGEKDALLNRTPLPDEPDGKPYGGYAGLSFRFAKDLTDIVAITSASDVPLSYHENRFRGKAAGLDYSGKIRGTEYGIAMIDHPQNLNAPSPWYVINDQVLRFCTPAVLCYGPHTLKAGQNFRLRYRTVIHSGRFTSQGLREEVNRFQ
jgi:hypothetical protein